MLRLRIGKFAAEGAAARIITLLRDEG